MQTPIALQLYTIREALEKDFEGSLNKIAEMGYLGVETASFPPEVSPEAASRLFQKLGLTIAASHLPLPLGEDKNKVLDMAGALGCQRMVCAYLPPEQYYDRLDNVRRACDLLNEANLAAMENGLAFGVHNHWWEFEPVEGEYPYHLWLEHLEPQIFFEIDTYWVKTAGLDPVKVLAEFGDRVPLLHIKDGPAEQEPPMTAVGTGVMDFPPIIEAANDTAEWLIVELDHCATDMLKAVSESYAFMIGEGLARGNKN